MSNTVKITFPTLNSNTKLKFAKIRTLKFAKNSLKFAKNWLKFAKNGLNLLKMLKLLKLLSFNVQNNVKHSKNYVSHSKQQYEAKICKNSLKFAKNC